MNDAAQKKWQELDARIAEAITAFEEIKKKLEASPVLAASSEGKKLKEKQRQLADKIKELRKRISKLQKDGVFDFSAIGGEGMVEVDGEFAEEVVADTSKLGKARPWTDPTFKKAFSDSIKFWCSDAENDLQNARLNMLKLDSGSSASATDLLAVLDLVGIAVPGWATALKVASGLAKLGAAAYKTAVKTSAPSPVELADAAIAYVRGIKDGDHSGPFNDLVDGMKAKGYQGDTVWEGEFLPECENFTKRYFGPPKKLTENFLSQMLAATEDSWDSGGGAGFADCWMTSPSSSAEHFGSPGGQLDDVSEGLVTAVRSVFKGKRVIDLPVPIRVTVQTHMGAYETVIERKNSKSGDTSFVMTSGSEHMYKGFMKGKFYEKLMVSHLQVDT